MALRSSSSHWMRRRSPSRGLAACCLLVVVVQLSAPSYVVGPSVQQQQQQRHRHGSSSWDSLIVRREAVSAAMLGAAAMLAAAAPASAAEAPKEAPELLDISGVPQAHGSANGQWTRLPGKDLNKRATYKRDGEELYIMVNDCGEFQLSSKVTGECTGFARQVEKGTWIVDGKELKGQVKIKPGRSLKPGDAVEVVAEFKSDDDEGAVLRKGLKGTVKEIDSEGDAEVDFRREDVNFVVKENFVKLKRTSS